MDLPRERGSLRVPSVERLGRWLPGIGLLVSGMVIGSAVYMSIHQNNFSILVREHIELLDENDNLKKEIQNLNKFRNSQSVIKKITVRFEEPSDPSKALDPAVEQELRQTVQKKLAAIYEGQNLSLFTGGGTDSQPVSEIQKLKEIISIRYFIRDRDYKVDTTAIAIIQTELIVFIQARQVNVSDSMLFR
jgi:hypothetical protein